MTDQDSRTDQRDVTAAWLMVSGLTDQLAATRIADALIAAGFTNGFPSTAHGAAINEVFANLRPADRIRLGDLITRNANCTDWPKWLHKALENAEHEDSIEDDRRTLASQLRNLAQAMAAVHATHQRLVTAHDVEYAEETLFRTYLDQAHLAIHTAIAVNPVKPQDR